MESCGNAGKEVGFEFGSGYGEAIPEEDQAVQLTITDDKYPVVKTLGVAWDSKEDILTLLASRVSSDLPLTKRNVLRTIAAVFDPLVFVSPFVII